MNQKPKYIWIKEELTKKIANGTYSPGEELPSENELIEQYKVSRITVRRAINELYLEGYIEKKQGKRGFVKEKRFPQELNKIHSYTEEILRMGMKPSRKVVVSQLRLCNDIERECLGLDKTDAVYHLERIIYADNNPLCYTTTSVPYLYFRDIEMMDFSKNSLYDKVENYYGIKISRSELTLKAVLPDSYVAKYLDVSKDSPLLYSNAVTYGMVDNKELPIEYFQTFYVTDRFEYKLSQQR